MKVDKSSCPTLVSCCDCPIPLWSVINVRKIGFVCVVTNKMLLAILTSVALFICTTFTTFDNTIRVVMCSSTNSSPYGR